MSRRIDPSGPYTEIPPFRTIHIGSDIAEVSGDLIIINCRTTIRAFDGCPAFCGAHRMGEMVILGLFFGREGPFGGDREAVSELARSDREHRSYLLWTTAQLTTGANALSSARCDTPRNPPRSSSCVCALSGRINSAAALERPLGKFCKLTPLPAIGRLGAGRSQSSRGVIKV